MSAHIVWDRGRLEASTEFINVKHEEIATGESVNSPAVYVHAGYRLTGSLSDLTPYFRYEDMDIGDGDVVFTPTVLSDYDAIVAGVRYDFDDHAALKAEYRSESIGGGERMDAYFIQASFAIPVSGG